MENFEKKIGNLKHRLDPDKPQKQDTMAPAPIFYITCEIYFKTFFKYLKNCKKKMLRKI